jgi:hypothetical protein
VREFGLLDVAHAIGVKVLKVGAMIVVLAARLEG